MHLYGIYIYVYMYVYIYIQIQIHSALVDKLRLAHTLCGEHITSHSVGRPLCFCGGEWLSQAANGNAAEPGVEPTTSWVKAWEPNH